MFEACCAQLHEQIVIEMNDDPAWARRFLQRLGIEELCGHELRRVADDDGCSLVLNWSLRMPQSTHDRAWAFIASADWVRAIKPEAWMGRIGTKLDGVTMHGVQTAAPVQSAR
jgi:hypothetical protein